MESKEWGQLMVCLGGQISGKPPEDFEENGLSRATPWKVEPVFRMDLFFGHVDSKEFRGLL